MARKFKTLRQRGAAIAETAAAMCLFLPLVLVILFVALEVSYAYVLKSTLSEAAREAARDLAIAYGLYGPAVKSSTAENQYAFDKIRIANIVNASEQFTADWSNETSDPPTVQVTCRYLSGKNGLPVFPNPDPLNLGANYIINGIATYRLQ